MGGSRPRLASRSASSFPRPAPAAAPVAHAAAFRSSLFELRSSPAIRSRLAWRSASSFPRPAPAGAPVAHAAAFRSSLFELRSSPASRPRLARAGHLPRFRPRQPSTNSADTDPVQAAPPTVRPTFFLTSNRPCVSCTNRRVQQLEGAAVPSQWSNRIRRAAPPRWRSCRALFAARGGGGADTLPCAALRCLLAWSYPDATSLSLSKQRPSRAVRGPPAVGCAWSFPGGRRKHRGADARCVRHQRVVDAYGGDPRC